MSVTPEKPYADKAIAKMQKAAQGAMLGVKDITAVTAGAVYSVELTLAEVQSSSKLRTCKFTGVVSHAKLGSFGFLKDGNTSSVAISTDEADDVLFIISDAIPKIMKARVFPAIIEHLGKNPPTGSARPGKPPAAKPPAATGHAKRR
jgi:hypothetical protein